MSGLDDTGIRVSYLLVTPGQACRREVHSDDPSPLAALGQLLNDLGAEGWELVTYEPTSNRGVFKRPKV
jgi:hypothetical protein